MLYLMLKTPTLHMTLKLHIHACGKQNKTFVFVTQMYNYWPYFSEVILATQILVCICKFSRPFLHAIDHVLENCWINLKGN